MSSGEIDFQSPPGQQDILRTMAEARGQMRTADEMERTLSYLKGENGDSDNWAETALKWFNYPAQFAATTLAKVAAPDDIARDFSFSMPERSSQQRSFYDLLLKGSGYERGDVLRNAGATVAGLGGLALDMLADPTLFLKVGAMTHGATALKMGLQAHNAELLRAASRAGMESSQARAFTAGKQLLDTGYNLNTFREALRAGVDVLPTPEHIAKGVARGDAASMRAAEGIAGMNRTLRELEGSGWLARPETEQLARGFAEEAVGGRRLSASRRTSLGGGRLLAFSRAHASDPSTIERAIAGAVAVPGEMTRKLTDKLARALGAVEQVGQLGLLNRIYQGQKHIDDRVVLDLYNRSTAIGGDLKQFRETLDLLEAPLATDATAYANLQQVKAIANDPKFEKLVVKADRGEGASVMRSGFGRDESYYSFRGLKQREMQEVLKSEQTGNIALGEGRNYRVIPLDEDQAVATKSLYSDMKGMPGWGQAGVTDDRAVVRRLLGGEVAPASIQSVHIDQLQRVLALAARKQWGLAPGRALEDAVAFAGHGTLQVVDPTAFAQYGTFQEALTASHAGATDFLQRIAPRVDRRLDILADPALAVAVKKEVKPSLLSVGETLLSDLSPQAAKSLRRWDRGILASAIDNPTQFTPEVVKSVADTVAREGSFPPIRIAVDPNTGRVLLADEASAKLLAAAEYLERAEVPVQRVGWVGEALSAPAKASAVERSPEALKQVSQRLESLLEHGIGGEEARIHLRRAGVSDEALDMLGSTRFIDDAGNDILTLQGLSKQMETAVSIARRDVAIALNRVVKDPVRVEQMLESVFKRVGSSYDIDHTAMNSFLLTIGDTEMSKGVQRALTKVVTLTDNVRAFLHQASGTYLNPQVLGLPRAFAVRPVEGSLKVVPLGVLQGDYAGAGMNAAARLANRSHLHPLTMMEVVPHPLDPGVVRGVGQRMPLSSLGNDTSVEKALARLDEEEIKGMMERQRGRFQIDPERRARLADEGVEIDPKNSRWFKDRRIPDTEIHSFIRLPGGSTIYGHGIGDTMALEEKVFGAFPHSVQEWGRVDQSGVHVYNAQWSILDGLEQPQVDLLNTRLQNMARDFIKAGNHADKEFQFAKYVAIDPSIKPAIFGDPLKPPTLAEVASGEYKVRIPEGWDHRVIDIAEPSAGGVVTVRGTSDATVQKLVGAFRQAIHSDLATEELMAQLMLPSSLRYGYFARILSPEGRVAVDKWMEAVAAEQKGGVGGRLYSYINQHYKKRSITQLSTNEVNELFDSGKLLVDGKPIVREDLLKVKTKDGMTLAKALKDDPEALSYFVTNVHDAMTIRALAGKRSLRNAQFIDSIKEMAIEVLPGQKEIPLETARSLIARAQRGEVLTEREQQVVDLLTKPGIYQATITRTEAQALVAKGQLDADMVKPLEGGNALLAVEGRMLDHPRWKGDHAIRFMPREAIAEMNRSFSRFSNIKSLNAFAAGYLGLQSMWKRMSLFATPKFYLRNIVGDMMLAWQGGLHPLDLGAHREAWSALSGYRQYTRFTGGSLEAGELALREGGDAARGFHPLTEITLPSGTTTYEREIEAANAAGVFHGTYARQLHRELNDTLAGRGISSINDMPLDTPFSRANWGKPVENVLEKGIKLHEGIENHFRFAIYLKQRRNGEEVGKAADIAKKVMGSTRELTPLEQTAGVGLMPFYRWMRFNIPRQVVWHVERPDQALRMWKAVDIIGKGGADVPEDELPKWAKNHHNLVMGKKNGEWGFITLDGFLPAADLRVMSEFVTDPGEAGSDTLLKGLSPFIRLPVEAMTGHTIEGQQMETVPGQLSSMALSDRASIPGLTRRATNQGPLGPGNLLWNEQVFNLFRPAKELSNLLTLFQKPEQDLGERLRNFLLVKVTTSDPLKQEILHQQDRQRTFNDLKTQYKRSVKEGNETKQRYWLGQINAHAIWSK